MQKINPIYLDDKNISEISSYYKNEGFVSLYDFYEKKLLNKIQKEILNLKFQRQSHPLKYNYEFADISDKLADLFDFSNLKSIISKLIGKSCKNISLKAYQLTWKSFTVLHDEEIEDPGIDLILDVTDYWEDEFGGIPVYVDLEGDALEIPATRGALTIISRENGEQKYIKYINHLARRKRFLIMGLISFF